MPEKTDLGKKFNSSNKTAIDEFNELCEKALDSPRPANRFECMDLLEEAVRKKKGAYTEANRQDWMQILYACLAAPNSYFIKDPIRAENKRVEKYTDKLNELISLMEESRQQQRAMYTYIDCIQKYMKTSSANTNKNQTSNYAPKLKDAVYQMLQQRIQKFPKLKQNQKDYQKKLNAIFVENQQDLNSPIFLLFLPYYLFFELAKCEGLILPDTNAYSIFQLTKGQLNWTIRSAPFSKEGFDANRFYSLYYSVESALCTALQERESYFIGDAFWHTEYECGIDIPDYLPPEGYKEEKIKESITEDAIVFSVPFWDYQRLARGLCRVFFEDEDEIKLQKDELELDFHKIFSLGFRVSTQAKRRQETILKKYEEYHVKLLLHTFKLSELLGAICDVYNPQSFAGSDPFSNENLCRSLKLLTGFLIANGNLDVRQLGESPDVQWLTLIEMGFPYVSAERGPKRFWSDIKHYLKNPSRTLFYAVARRWGRLQVKDPGELLSTVFVYHEFLKKFSNALYGALCSEKQILRDIYTWCGIKVCLDTDYANTMSEAFHVWSVWNPDGAEKYRKFDQRIRKDRMYQMQVVTALKEHSFETVELSVIDYTFDGELTEELNEHKKEMFSKIPLLKETFGKATELSDFQYALIFYFTFRVLRDRMCFQAFDICTKILEDHFIPPNMFWDR